MKQELKEAFESMQSMDGMEAFIQMIELPDEEFDKVYPKLKTEVSNILNSSSLDRELRDRMGVMDSYDADSERAAAEEFVKMIKDDDTLSENKREFLILVFGSTIDRCCEMIENPRERIPVRVKKLHPDAVLPTYAHPTDAGADISSIEEVVIKPHSTVVVKTGLSAAVPKGYEIQIRPRSGLSLKTSLRIANCVGTIDSSYRGEIGVIMENTGNLSITIEKGQKIAQMLIAPTPMIEWKEVDELDTTTRGDGGFGSTDSKS